MEVTRTAKKHQKTHLPMFGLVVERLTVTMFTIIYFYPVIELEEKRRKKKMKRRRVERSICFLAAVD